jgi:mono/diheme cytochrome c family protein
MDRILRSVALSSLCGGLLLGAAALVAAQAKPTAEAAAKAMGSADVAKGKQVFSLYCQTCHGPAGAGDGPAGKTLNPPPRDFTKAEFKFGGKDEDIFAVISNGAAVQKAGDGTPGSPLMAPWGNVIPEGDRWALVKFIRTLKK